MRKFVILQGDEGAAYGFWNHKYKANCRGPIRSLGSGHPRNHPPEALNHIMMFRCERALNESIAFHTYSPFTIYTINNELLRWRFSDGKAGLNPNVVEAYEIQDDGTAIDLMDHEEGLFACVYEKISNELGEEFDNMLYSLTPEERKENRDGNQAATNCEPNTIG
jgi:hypothetical protein